MIGLAAAVVETACPPVRVHNWVVVQLFVVRVEDLKFDLGSTGLVEDFGNFVVELPGLDFGLPYFVVVLHRPGLVVLAKGCMAFHSALDHSYFEQ